MIVEATHFEEECDTLAKTLEGATDTDLQKTTLFNAWTIEDVIGHLHVWNLAAMMTLESRDAFQNFFSFAMKHFSPEGGSLPVQYAWFDAECGGLRGQALLDAWRDAYPRTAAAYAAADPDQRVAWAGPDMSARSKIIARQMETWAHGQEIFDRLGLDREENDRIKNIAHLGVTTYSWTFRNRGEEPPNPKPFVQLTAPSGAVWEWNEPQTDNKLNGVAAEFCQVVTQVRNIDDTSLEAVGDAARRWMETAQCFAGPPKTPPMKGARHKHR